MISAVSPVYHGEKTVRPLVERLMTVLSQMNEEVEIILVEDGSPDDSWSAIESVCRDYLQVKGVRLSRNFGQHYAITAGLEHATGDWVVVMDCDLQDQPEEIPCLYKKAQEGYDIVFAQRKLRQDRLFKRWSSKVFYSVFGYLTGTRQDPSIANFGIYNRRVVKAILSMNDAIRFFPTMVQWVGFKSTKIEVEHSSREEGKSTYSWSKLFKLAWNNIIAFSDKPLKILMTIGVVLSIFSFLLGLAYLYRYLSGQITVLGYTSLILAITFFSGLIMSMLGLIGIYVGKTFNQVKERPTFIVSDTLNVHNEPQ